MNVVDSSAWLEYFADGPQARHVAAAVKATDDLVVPTVTLYEVFKVVLRETSEHDALQAVAALRKGLVVDLTPTLALAAGQLSLRHALPMADAIILATAQAYGATLWTLDAHFKGLPGVRYAPKKPGAGTP
ncbi:MAG: type II toxin-antitoxin system VapC family toxin [Lentisphaeria bacterium]